VFKAGHTIRVDIASSNFPRFDRNPGNGALSASATEADLITARQTLFHDAARPSRIVLPVIPRPSP
jgi:predicted acyl esterase